MPDHSDSEIEQLCAAAQDAERRQKSAEQKSAEQQLAALKCKAAGAGKGKKSKKNKANDDDCEGEAQQIKHSGVLVIYCEDLFKFFSFGNCVYDVPLHPDYLNSKNLVPTGDDGQVQVVQADEDRWETWEEFAVLKRSSDYAAKGAKDKAAENKELKTQFEHQSDCRERFNHLFLATEASNARNQAAARICGSCDAIFKGFNLSDNVTVTALLEDDGFLYEDGQRPEDHKERKAKFLKGPMVRAFQALLYGPQAIGKKLPYASSKATHGRLLGLHKITPAFVAAMHVLMYHTLDHVNCPAPFAQKVGKDKVKGKGAKRKTPEFSELHYGKPYQMRRAVFSSTLTKATAAKRLADLNDAVIPPIEGGKELTLASRTQGRQGGLQASNSKSSLRTATTLTLEGGAGEQEPDS
ncbi:hypothetical protein JCM5296_007587 [Sporobolomyces johnsonii]